MKGMICVMKKQGIIIIMMLSILMLGQIPPAGASEISERIFPYISGSIGFVVVDQQRIIQLNSDYQGLSLEQRLTIVAQRLRRLAAGGGIQEASLKVVERRGNIGLMVGDQWLILADPASAYHQGVNQYQLVETWRKNLLDKLPDMGQNYQVVTTLSGTASWYGRKFRGRQTANGEIFDERNYTAAHRSLKFGTKVRVTNLANGLAVIVTINDRGPWVKNREIDLSWAAAQAIGIQGLGKVRIEVLK